MATALAAKPSVLFLTDIVPSPRATNAGGKMFAYYARELQARRWSVSFLALGMPHELAWAHDLGDVVEWSRVLPIRRDRVSRLRRAAQQLVRPPEYSIVRESGVEHILFGRLVAHHVDIVHALHPWLIGAARRAINRLPPERRPALVGHIMDIAAVQALDRAQSHPSAWLRPLHLLAFARWAWREFNDYAAADVWLAHTQADIEVVRLFGSRQKPAVVSPVWFNGIEQLANGLLQHTREGDFLFVGSIHDARTRHSLSWLIGHVFPIFVQLYQNPIRLFVAGTAGWQVPPALAKPYVVFCGAGIADSELLALYDRVQALLFPLQEGRFSRHVKVMTAFARGCPVIMTKQANWTLNALHGQEALIADTPQSFAEAMLWICRDNAMAHRLAQGGFARLRAEYPDADVVIRTVEQAYAHALAQIR